MRALIPPLVRRLVVNSILGLASALLTAAVLEASARLLHIERRFILHPTSGNCLRRSPDLGIDLRPSCVGELSGTRFRTDALGFRGDELRGGARRILTLGDSCTWGWRVADDEAYPAVLQRLLDGRPPARYDVVNGGVPGYTSHHGLVVLREKGLPLAPAIVTLGFGFNDAFASGDIAEEIARERRLRRFLLVDDFLIDHSILYAWLRVKTTRASPPVGAASPLAADRPVRVSPERYRQNLTEMVQLARGAGARVVLLSFWRQPVASEVPYRDAIPAVATALEVPLIVYEGPRLDVVHPTVEGHRRLAERLLATLDERGWIAP